MKAVGGIVAAAVCAVAAGGCWGGDPAGLPGDAVPVDEAVVLVDEWSTGVGDARRLAIRSQEAWTAFWDEVYRDRGPVAGAPAIDFGAHMVVAATLGARPNGGYDIAVEAVYRSGDDLFAVVRSTSPGDACVTAAAVTTPAHAVRVPRVSGEVVFLERSRVIDC